MQVNAGPGVVLLPEQGVVGKPVTAAGGRTEHRGVGSTLSGGLAGRDARAGSGLGT